MIDTGQILLLAPKYARASYLTHHFPVTFIVILMRNPMERMLDFQNAMQLSDSEIQQSLDVMR